MKQYLTSLLAASLFLAACGNNASSKNEGLDTAAEEPENTETAWTQDALPQLYQRLEAQDASFDPDLFAETEGGTTTPTPARFFPPEELGPFRPYLVYNADSTRAIDLVTYNYIIDKNDGQPVLEPTGPDTEVAVIDLKTNMRTRIFFSGPGTIIRDGKWLDENTVLLGGAENVSSTAIKPILLRINLEENTLQRFTYQDSLQANIR